MHTQTQRTAALAAVCNLATRRTLDPPHRSTGQFIVDLRSHLATYPVSAHTTHALHLLWRNCRRTNGSTPAVDYTDAHLLTGADGLQDRIVCLLNTRSAPTLHTHRGTHPPQWHISADHPGKKGPLWNDAHALLHKVCAQHSPDHTLQLQAWFAGIRPRLYKVQLQRADQCLRVRHTHADPVGGRPVGGRYRSRDLRWYPAALDELQTCCHAVRSPTHRSPYTLHNHCRSAEHIAHLYGVNLADLHALHRTKQ